ncbi:MAG TPA: hypothetical protein VMZ66_00345, partial [Aeromicrobium sp.]|nr:hypothetical protein [Aeromicrobium sp.]
MRLKRDVRVIAGSLAIASGVAYFAYLLPFEGRDRAITAWNLLIIPAIVYLGGWLASRAPVVASASTAAGVTASLLWALAFRSPTLEPWWIGLAAAGWLGFGWLLLREYRALGRFTLVLGVATIIDLVVTVMNASMPLYLLGAFKLPLTTAWTLWIGLTLVRDSRWSAERSLDGDHVGADAVANVGLGSGAGD